MDIGDKPIEMRKVTEWGCPNCHITDVTYETQPHTRFHTCPGLNDLTAPMIPKGIKVQVRALMREDYVGKEMVQLDANNRAAMAVQTEYADGRTDIAILAPTAQATAY